MKPELLISIVALCFSFLTLLGIFIQIRLLRKSIEATNYQDLIGKLLSTRTTVATHPSLGKMFTENPEVGAHLESSGIQVDEYFWLLSYFTILENFYFQRKIGVMQTATWEAYLRTIAMVFSTPRIKAFWESYRHLKTYRRDWADFVNRICNSEEVDDPILPWWRRTLFRR